MRFSLSFNLTKGFITLHGTFMIMTHGSIGEVPIPSVDPYSEILEIEEKFSNHTTARCPVCNSPHTTSFSKIMTVEGDSRVISGDLSIRRLTIIRCLNCGHDGPIKFTMVRNM